MKLLIKLMLTLLVLAAALPFTPFMPGGKPLLSLGNLKWPKLEAPSLPALKPAGGTSSSNNQTFYKWHDAKGNLHFSDQPPKGHTAQLETVEVNPNTNLIPGVKAPPPQPQQKPAQEATATSLPSPYSPDQIKRLFDEAHKIKQQSEQRNKQLEEIMGKAK